MSSVATMIAKIEDQMEAEQEAPAANPEHLRMVEALLFAASEPVDQKALTTSLPEGADVPGLLAALEQLYEKRGVTLCCVAGKYQFRTASDLAFLLRKEKPEQKRLSRAAIETLAIIAYHQPVTRAEIADIRGVIMSKGTVDTLMEIGGVGLYGVVSVLLFVTVFTGAVVWALSLRRPFLQSMGALPLSDGTPIQNESKESRHE